MWKGILVLVVVSLTGCHCHSLETRLMPRLDLAKIKKEFKDQRITSEYVYRY